MNGYVLYDITTDTWYSPSSLMSWTYDIRLAKRFDTLSFAVNHMDNMLGGGVISEEKMRSLICFKDDDGVNYFDGFMFWDYFSEKLKNRLW